MDDTYYNFDIYAFFKYSEKFKNGNDKKIVKLFYLKVVF